MYLEHMTHGAHLLVGDAVVELGLGELATAERDDLQLTRRWISLFNDESETLAARVG